MTIIDSFKAFGVNNFEPHSSLEHQAVDTIVLNSKMFTNSLLVILALFFTRVQAQPQCKYVHIQGTEPKALNEKWGGWLNIFIGTPYTFQEEALLIGWQVYIKFDSDSYFLDVFRAVSGVADTYDRVHSTEHVNPKAGNQTVMVETPFKV